MEVKYYYLQYFLPTPRHRKERVRELCDTLSVHCTELSEDEFPLAFIVHKHESVLEGMTSYRDYDSDKCEYRVFDEEIRTYKGKFYKPIRVSHGAAISTVFEGEDHIIYILQRAAKPQYIEPCESFTKESVVLWDTKKYTRQMLRKKAKEYILFEDKFWEECGEPVYVGMTFGLGHNHGGTALFIQYAKKPNKYCFNASQRDEAIAYWRLIAIHRGDTESIPHIEGCGNIEVVKPELVSTQRRKH